MLTGRQNEGLIAAVTVDEIKKVVKHMSSKTAQGSDGFQVFFF